MPASLDGKVALITGGSRGQGAAEAHLFTQSGARVVIADVLVDEGQALAAEIAAAGGQATFVRLDVSKRDEWEAAVALTRNTYGGLHVLVNNAGVALRTADLISTTQADWDRLMSINLTGAFIGIQSCAPLIRDSGGGAIVNIGSAAGMTGHFATAYSVTKWGLRGLSHSAAMELAKWNIRVNCVHPGIVHTPIVAASGAFMQAMLEASPRSKIATAEDVALVVAFLASDDAAAITAIDIPVDGGLIGAGTYFQVRNRAAGGGDVSKL